MYPPRFDYVSPSSLDEALSLLAGGSDDGPVKVLSGGQSLIPLLKLRFASPSKLVDINRIPGLDTLEESGDHLRIGALVRHATLERSSLLRERYPTMAAAAPQIADPIVRNLGTLAGSLAHADPAGDWGSVMLALGGEIVARSAGGERVIPVKDFFRGLFQTALEPGEIVVEVRVPKPASACGGAYLKLERKVGDFATVGVATHLQLDGDRISRAGIGLTAVGQQNLEATAAEQALEGQTPSAELFEEAARLAAEAAQPTSNERGSAEYKRDMVRVYTKRGLQHCLEQARGGGS
jgi:carbon-monoxide dehydrogenase medium subunit